MLCERASSPDLPFLSLAKDPGKYPLLFLARERPWQNNAMVLRWRGNANISCSWNGSLPDRNERSSRCTMARLSRPAYSANGWRKAEPHGSRAEAGRWYAGYVGDLEKTGHEMSRESRCRRH